MDYLALPVKLRNGFLRRATREESISYSIGLILSTRKGSLPFDIEFGWDLWEREFSDLVLVIKGDMKSNIRNVNDESEIVLGFFSMAGVEEKRAFAVKPEGLDLSLYEWYCFPVSSGPPGPITRDDLPKYYARAWKDGESSFAEVNKHCVDCRAYKNSSHIKPDFW